MSPELWEIKRFIRHNVFDFERVFENSSDMKFLRTPIKLNEF